jgi:aldehyde dehydrogenase (NAD+)
MTGFTPRSREALFIDGRWQPATGGHTIEVINPATEQIITRVPAASRADVNAAVAAARAAFPGWARTPVEDRCAALDRLHTAYVHAAEELAQTITCELGAPITMSRNVHTEIPGQVIEQTAAMARAYDYRRATHTLGGQSLLLREAYGVVAAITPWNNPLYMMLLKVAPAVAAGCTVVHKCAEQSPLSTQLVAAMLHDAGLPRGVYNLITGNGQIAGSALTSDPRVDMVSFTGSTAAGAKVAADAAVAVSRTVLELGGKSASVVLDDADLGLAVEHTVRSAFNNAGQMCGAWTRLIVPRHMLSEATERAVTLAEQHVVGDPADEATTMGPVVSAKQRDSIVGYIERGIADGARLATGGPTPPDGLGRGYYVRPTVFADVDNGSTIAQEEIFGPVLCIIAHDGDDNAADLANASPYGLRGAVFSADENRALTLAAQLRTGQVDLNGYKLTPDIPFGGYKRSGYGRCQGVLGFEEYLQTKSVQL